MTANTKLWLHGLAAATVSSLSTALSGAVVLPDVFNFSNAGMLNTLKLVVVPTIVSVCAYLKSSPLPSPITATVDSKGNISDVSGSVEVDLKSKN